MNRDNYLWCADQVKTLLLCGILLVLVAKNMRAMLFHLQAFHYVDECMGWVLDSHLISYVL